ncbi:MAG: hypothetical protein ABEJ25_04105 [Candidatus Bipolaricaulia bacterium]
MTVFVIVQENPFQPKLNVEAERSRSHPLTNTMQAESPARTIGPPGFPDR